MFQALARDKGLDIGGDRVARGQPLASLRADVERVSVTVAQSRAQGLGELRAAIGRGVTVLNNGRATLR